MQAVALSLLVASCIVDFLVAHRNSSSTNHSALKVALKSGSLVAHHNSSSTDQLASKVVPKSASNVAPKSASKAALKSEENLQAEVRRLKEENERLRGLLSNATQKSVTATAAAVASQDSATTSAKRKLSPSHQTASKPDVKPTAPVAVKAVNRALDAAARKNVEAKTILKNVSAGHESTRAKLRASIKALDRDEAEIAKLEKSKTPSPATYTKEPLPAARVTSADSAKDAAIDQEAAKVMHLVESEAMAASNSTRKQKIMRQLVAPPAETMKPMIKVFKQMIIKLEKLNKHDGDENRMLFCEQIAKDLESCQVPFKDHEGITYKEHSASDCLGVRGPLDVEIISDSANECQTKCNDLGPDCAGFLHMTSGRDAGKCLFKKGGIKDVKSSDTSTCFEKEDPRDPLVKKFVALNLWVLEQASSEIDWICQAGFRSTREESRVEAFRLTVETYMDGIQCQPGDIPCPGGHLKGEKPTCECVKD
jgi:hypothetical protein